MKTNTDKPIREITCVYCGFKLPLDDKDTPTQMTDHIFSCEKNPLVEALTSALARAESAEKELAEARKALEPFAKLAERRSGDGQK